MEVKVAEGLVGLRPEFRTLIVLRDLQGLSYQEIGSILGCSEKAVKSRLFRGPHSVAGCPAQAVPKGLILSHGRETVTLKSGGSGGFDASQS